ncbi:MAG TPA: VOC family protein [Acidimicrobiia bacterium]|nr:VOC family protein [Acidimicrobiia bacterium]
MTRSTTGLGGFHHVALTVRDVDVSARWYADVFGFVELFREDSPERRAVVMAWPDGAFGVGLVEHVPSEGGRFDPRRIGLDHVGFTLGSREGLDEWVERLSAESVDHSGVIDAPRGAILNLKDPDGIALALFWDRA